jgi:hypothetical protein
MTIKNFDSNAPKRAMRKTEEAKEEKTISKNSNEVNTSLLKTAESIFAPKPVLHKLIAGKHNYKEFKDNLTDNGEIYIRRFTSIEENLFKALLNDFTMKKFFEVLNSTFVNCVRSNIDCYKLSMIEQIYLFVHIYYLTYGDLKADIKCKLCEFTKPVTIDLMKDFQPEFLKEDELLINPIKLTTYDDEMHVWIKFPTLEEQLIYLDDTVAWENKVKLLIDRIETALENGSVIDKKDYYEIIINLNYEDKEAIRVNFEKFSTKAVDLSETKTTFICENKKCNNYNIKSNIEVPIELFFEKIYKSFV